MRISVITVCYNSEVTIERTFQYMLAQTLPDFEYLVIDGLSTDKTVDIIKRYAPKFEERGVTFRWISEKDKGIYDAMNKGITMVRGEWIGIINSDDHYMPDTLAEIERQVAFHPDIDVFHGLLRHTTNGKLTRITGVSSDLLCDNMLEHPTCFVRKDIYEKYGAFNLQYRFVADYDLMLRLKEAGCRFFLIEKVMADFDENGMGNSWASVRERIALQKKRGLISLKKYWMLLFKNYLYWLKKK